MSDKVSKELCGCSIRYGERKGKKVSMMEIVLRSGIVSLSFSVVQALLAFLVVGYSLRVFGELAVGLVQATQATVLFTIGLSGMPVITSALIQYVSESSEAPNITQDVADRFNSSLGYLFLICSLFFICFLSINPFGEKWALMGIAAKFSSMSMYNSLILLWVMSEQVTVLIISFLFGRRLLIQANLISGLFGAANQTIIFLSIFVFKEFLIFLIIMAAFSVVRLIAAYLIACRYNRGLRLFPSTKFSRIRKMPMVNKSAYIGSLSNPLVSQADRLILSYISGVAALPIYALAQSALSAVHSVIHNICHPFFPLLSAEGKNAVRKAKKMEFLQRWIVSLMGAFLYGISILFLPILLSYIVTVDIGERSRMFVILASLQGMLICYSTVPIFGLLALKKTKILAIMDWGNSSLVLGLAVPLTIFLGPLGTAFSRLGFIFQAIFSTWHYTAELGLRKIADKFRPLIPSFLFLLLIILYSYCIHSLRLNRLVELSLNLIFLMICLSSWLLIDYMSEKRKENVYFILRILGTIRSIIFRKV